MSDIWPEIARVLDKYSTEAWLAGGLAERERIIRIVCGLLDTPVCRCKEISFTLSNAKSNAFRHDSEEATN